MAFISFAESTGNTAGANGWNVGRKPYKRQLGDPESSCESDGPMTARKRPV